MPVISWVGVPVISIYFDLFLLFFSSSRKVVFAKWWMNMSFSTMWLVWNSKERVLTSWHKWVAHHDETLQNRDPFNTLRPRLNGHHFPDIFKCLFVNENAWIFIKIPLKFVPKCSIDNIPALVQIMAWHSPGDKPLSEPMMVSLLTHIRVTQPQWVK